MNIMLTGFLAIAVSAAALDASAGQTVIYTKKPWTVVRVEAGGGAFCAAFVDANKHRMQVTNKAGRYALSVSGAGWSFSPHKGNLHMQGGSTDVVLVQVAYSNAGAVTGFPFDNLKSTYNMFDWMGETRIAFLADTGASAKGFPFAGWQTAFEKLEACGR